NLKGVENIYDTTAEDAYRLARSVDAAEAEAVFLSGTGMPTVPVLEALEQDLGKPVISSASAMMWHALRSAGIGQPIAGYGGLLATRPRARCAAPVPPQATTAGEPWDRLPQCHARPNSRSIVDRMDKAGYRDEPHLWSGCQFDNAGGATGPRRACPALCPQCRRDCCARGVLQQTPGRLCRDGGDRRVRETALWLAVGCRRAGSHRQSAGGA